MRYLALATDFDGTLAHHDEVPEAVVWALQRLRTSGRRAILVTGRQVDDLLEVCPFISLFALVVAENGAVIYNPTTRERTRLAEPLPPRLLDGLRDRGVDPLAVGQVLVGTRAEHRATAQDVIWDLGLEVQVIGNRNEVMLLPAGVNKATGLDYALRELSLSRHEVVGIGDAENDHSFLRHCECPVAVANASPSIKEIAAFVTKRENGAGVVELVDEVIADDLRRMSGRLSQHWIRLGTDTEGAAVHLAPYGHNMLIAGPSGSGKSTFVAGVIERLIDKDYQVCIVDPEGDFSTMRDVVPLGNQWRAPSVSEITSILEDPKVNVSVNTLGIPLGDRPDFIAQLLPALQAMRARSGRPHWIVLDEAHHLLPDTWGHGAAVLPMQVAEMILVTVHPEHLDPTVLGPVDVVVAVGSSPRDTLAGFARAARQDVAPTDGLTHRPGHVVTWLATETGSRAFSMRPKPGRAERIRHRRKYAEGDLRWHSFYFRGPEDRLNLRAQNLVVFCQLAEGVDEQTWMFHLRRGDYSAWFRHAVHDDYLADATEQIERRSDVDPWQTRQVIRELINARYTLPA